MEVNFNDFRTIDILVNQDKDIAIFPLSRTKGPVELANGKVIDYSYHTAYYPIELKYPYPIEQLAEKIKEGIEEWDKHPCYEDEFGKNSTYEAKYYGETSFKKAIKGKRYIQLGWDSILRKYIILFIPLKRGHAYMGMDRIKLSDDADWIDFAEAVMRYADIDITTLKGYKAHKNSLNL